MKKSITKNYIYNLTYQLFLILMPILTTPYVSRTLGAEGIGQYSFANSLVSYFCLFAAFGFGHYAQREIAKHQGDIREQTKLFWEIILARGITVGVVLAVYLVLLSAGVWGRKYTPLMALLTVSILSIAFDPTFLFSGNEEFGKIVLRNALIKLGSIACVFLLIRSPQDVGMYLVLHSVPALLSHLSLYVYLPKMLGRVCWASLEPLRHLRPALILFLPTIAVSVYTSLDKTMIGLLTGLDAENGYYEQAEKIVKMVMTVVTSLGTVMIPKNANAFHNKDMEAIRQNISRSVRFVLMLGIPMGVGLIAVSDNMIPWFLGDGYAKSAGIMKLLSLLVVIIGLSGVFGLQYLVPAGEDKRFAAAILCGAVSNFLLNLLLIPGLKSYGAAIATIIAESIVTAVMLGYVHKHIPMKHLFAQCWKYGLSGAVMGIPCLYLGSRLPAAIGNTFLISAVGVGIYFAGLLALRDAFFLELLQKALGLAGKKANPSPPEKENKGE